MSHDQMDAPAGTFTPAEPKTKKYPIAEMFCSPQGEGLYAGAMMQFVRLAGCSVGKKLRAAEADLWMQRHPSFHDAPLYNDLGRVSGTASTDQLQIYTEKCTTYDGREFLCDTDFRTKAVLTAEEIIARIPDGVERICLTGGEPLNHDLTQLLELAWNKMLDVHIETSGTVPIQKAYPSFDVCMLLGESVEGWIWLTVSPKLGVLDEMLGLASEVKFLVNAEFDPEKIPEAAKHKALFYIQPINEEFTVNQDNLRLCLELQKKYPHWRISNQSHKIWNVR